ncbi:Hypothetical protein CINCED_3A015794 [Cinara cedri]|uniref:Uncharacterized protein n=1 Tax=Cinara cedri TaxID=506608 RepID=A0A5E4MVY9_9HEMI|nr:Hypothetical protein CINCED_3A015794 [Cinara cedri]
MFPRVKSKWKFLIIIFVVILILPEHEGNFIGFDNLEKAESRYALETEYGHANRYNVPSSNNAANGNFTGFINALSENQHQKPYKPLLTPGMSLMSDEPQITHRTSPAYLRSRKSQKFNWPLMSHTIQKDKKPNKQWLQSYQDPQMYQKHQQQMVNNYKIPRQVWPPEYATRLIDLVEGEPEEATIMLPYKVVLQSMSPDNAPHDERQFNGIGYEICSFIEDKELKRKIPEFPRLHYENFEEYQQRFKQTTVQNIPKVEAWRPTTFDNGPYFQIQSADLDSEYTAQLQKRIPFTKEEFDKLVKRLPKLYEYIDEYKLRIEKEGLSPLDQTTVKCIKTLYPSVSQSYLTYKFEKTKYSKLDIFSYREYINFISIFPIPAESLDSYLSRCQRMKEEDYYGFKRMYPGYHEFYYSYFDRILKMNLVPMEFKHFMDFKTFYPSFTAKHETYYRAVSEQDHWENNFDFSKLTLDDFKLYKQLFPQINEFDYQTYLGRIQKLVPPKNNENDEIYIGRLQSIGYPIMEKDVFDAYNIRLPRGYENFEYNKKRLEKNGISLLNEDKFDEFKTLGFLLDETYQEYEDRMKPYYLPKLYSHDDFNTFKLSLPRIGETYKEHWLRMQTIAPQKLGELQDEYKDRMIDKGYIAINPEIFLEIIESFPYSYESHQQFMKRLRVFIEDLFLPVDVFKKLKYFLPRICESLDQYHDRISGFGFSRLNQMQLDRYMANLPRIGELKKDFFARLNLISPIEDDQNNVELVQGLLQKISHIGDAKYVFSGINQTFESFNSICPSFLPTYADYVNETANNDVEVLYDTEFICVKSFYPKLEEDLTTYNSKLKSMNLQPLIPSTHFDNFIELKKIYPQLFHYTYFDYANSVKFLSLPTLKESEFNRYKSMLPNLFDFNYTRYVDRVDEIKRDKTRKTLPLLVKVNDEHNDQLLSPGDLPGPYDLNYWNNIYKTQEERIKNALDQQKFTAQFLTQPDLYHLSEADYKAVKSVLYPTRNETFKKHEAKMKYLGLSPYPLSLFKYLKQIHPALGESYSLYGMRLAKVYRNLSKIKDQRRKQMDALKKHIMNGYEFDFFIMNMPSPFERNYLTYTSRIRNENNTKEKELFSEDEFEDILSIYPEYFESYIEYSLRMQDLYLEPMTQNMFIRIKLVFPQVLLETYTSYKNRVIDHIKQDKPPKPSGPYKRGPFKKLPDDQSSWTSSRMRNHSNQVNDSNKNLESGQVHSYKESVSWKPDEELLEVYYLQPEDIEYLLFPLMTEEQYDIFISRIPYRFESLRHYENRMSKLKLTNYVETNFDHLKVIYPEIADTYEEYTNTADGLGIPPLSLDDFHKFKRYYPREDVDDYDVYVENVKHWLLIDGNPLSLGQTDVIDEVNVRKLNKIGIPVMTKEEFDEHMTTKPQGYENYENHCNRMKKEGLTPFSEEKFDYFKNLRPLREETYEEFTKRLPDYFMSFEKFQKFKSIFPHFGENFEEFKGRLKYIYPEHPGETDEQYIIGMQELGIETITEEFFDQFMKSYPLPYEMFKDYQARVKHTAHKSQYTNGKSLKTWFNLMKRLLPRMCEDLEAYSLRTASLGYINLNNEQFKRMIYELPQPGETRTSFEDRLNMRSARHLYKNLYNNFKKVSPRYLHSTYKEYSSSLENDLEPMSVQEYECYQDFYPILTEQVESFNRRMKKLNLFEVNANTLQLYKSIYPRVTQYNYIEYAKQARKTGLPIFPEREFIKYKNLFPSIFDTYYTYKINMEDPRIRFSEYEFKTIKTAYYPLPNESYTDHINKMNTFGLEILPTNIFEFFKGVFPRIDENYNSFINRIYVEVYPLLLFGKQKDPAGIEFFNRYVLTSIQFYYYQKNFPRLVEFYKDYLKRRKGLEAKYRKMNDEFGVLSEELFNSLKESFYPIIGESFSTFRKKMQEVPSSRLVYTTFIKFYPQLGENLDNYRFRTMDVKMNELKNIAYLGSVPLTNEEFIKFKKTFPKPLDIYEYYVSRMAKLQLTPITKSVFTTYKQIYPKLDENYNRFFKRMVSCHLETSTIVFEYIKNYYPHIEESYIEYHNSAIQMYLTLPPAPIKVLVKTGKEYDHSPTAEQIVGEFENEPSSKIRTPSIVNISELNTSDGSDENICQEQCLSVVLINELQTSSADAEPTSEGRTPSIMYIDEIKSSGGVANPPSEKIPTSTVLLKELKKSNRDVSATEWHPPSPKVESFSQRRHPRIIHTKKNKDSDSDEMKTFKKRRRRTKHNKKVKFSDFEKMNTFKKQHQDTVTKIQGQPPCTESENLPLSIVHINELHISDVDAEHTSEKRNPSIVIINDLQTTDAKDMSNAEWRPLSIVLTHDLQTSDESCSEMQPASDEEESNSETRPLSQDIAFNHLIPYSGYPSTQNYRPESYVPSSVRTLWIHQKRMPILGQEIKFRHALPDSGPVYSIYEVDSTEYKMNEEIRDLIFTQELGIMPEELFHLYKKLLPYPLEYDGPYRTRVKSLNVTPFSNVEFKSISSIYPILGETFDKFNKRMKGLSMPKFTNSNNYLTFQRILFERNRYFFESDNAQFIGKPQPSAITDGLDSVQSFLDLISHGQKINY